MLHMNLSLDTQRDMDLEYIFNLPSLLGGFGDPNLYWAKVHVGGPRFLASRFTPFRQVDAYVDALGDGASPFEQLPDVPPSGSEGSGQGLAQVKEGVPPG